MFVRIWRFRAAPGKAADFRRAYGTDGLWADLFRRGAGYVGTELLASTRDPDVYFTLDRWESAEAWEAFLGSYGTAYKSLDEQCETLTTSEDEVGAFRAAAV